MPSTYKVLDAEADGHMLVKFTAETGQVQTVQTYWDGRDFDQWIATLDPFAKPVPLAKNENASTYIGKAGPVPALKVMEPPQQAIPAQQPGLVTEPPKE